MSVFEKCLALGVELRNSAQGKEILALKGTLNEKGFRNGIARDSNLHR